jgi:hypothetical protein
MPLPPRQDGCQHGSNTVPCGLSPQVTVGSDDPYRQTQESEGHFRRKRLTKMLQNASALPWNPSNPADSATPRSSGPSKGWTRRVTQGSAHSGPPEGTQWAKRKDTRVAKRVPVSGVNVGYRPSQGQNAGSNPPSPNGSHSTRPTTSLRRILPRLGNPAPEERPNVGQQRAPYMLEPVGVQPRHDHSRSWLRFERRASVATRSGRTRRRSQLLQH